MARHHRVTMIARRRRSLTWRLQRRQEERRAFHLPQQDRQLCAYRPPTLRRPVLDSCCLRRLVDLTAVLDRADEQVADIPNFEEALREQVEVRADQLRRRAVTREEATLVLVEEDEEDEEEDEDDEEEWDEDEEGDEEDEDDEEEDEEEEDDDEEGLSEVAEDDDALQMHVKAEVSPLYLQTG